MEDRIRPLELAFAPSIIDDEQLQAVRSWLRQVMMDCGVFRDDPVRAEELLDVIITYLKYTCPLRADEESLRIAALYGGIIILHGTGILTGAHLELTPEAFVRHLSTGVVEGEDPPESAVFLAELGRMLQARSTSREATSVFIHYAGRTYRAYREKRERLLRGARYASLSEYERNRAYRIGLYPYFWLWVAIHELVSPALLLGDERLRRMLALANLITYMRNDIATLRRDIHDGNENYVLYVEEDLGCGRDRALEIVKERCNDTVRELLELERAVTSSPDGPPAQEVAGYFGFLESLMVGNLLAFEVFASMRYVEMDTLAK
jgi:hypothetical protein